MRGGVAQGPMATKWYNQDGNSVTTSVTSTNRDSLFYKCNSDSINNFIDICKQNSFSNNYKHL